MSIMENPFTPSFGEIPLHLAGREEIIASLSRAFAGERRRPELTSLFVGARGTGKTALLAYLASLAERHGWISVSATATAGLLDDVEIQALRKASHLLESEDAFSVKSVGIPEVLSVDLGGKVERKSNWRSRMEDVLSQLDGTNTGLLITIDEVDPDLDEMVHLASVYQHYVLEGRKVALLMAGLPHNVSSLISNRTVSFLRRANLVHLGRIPDYEVADAFRRTVRDTGRDINEEVLGRATRAIDGFPYMMQLVGFHAWDESGSEANIDAESLDRGLRMARNDLSHRVLDATYRELSPEDVRFLLAMTEDEGDSAIADLTKRLGRSTSQVAQYRKRLIDAGVIGRRARGVVGFELPYFREYLIELAEEEGLAYEKAL